MRLRRRSIRRPLRVAATSGSSQEGEETIGDSEALGDAGQLVAALDRLVAGLGDPIDPQLAVDVVTLRHQAAMDRDPGQGRTPWPPRYADPFPDLSGTLPEIAPDDLSTEVLGGAVAHHGALVVRGLLDPDQVERHVVAIDRARAGQDAWQPGGVGDPWFRPLKVPPMVKNQVLRNHVADQGGTWLGDSPASTEQLLADLQSAGVIAAMTDHFGERLSLSLQKSTLRRSLPVNRLTAWHQDGSFLSPGVRTMNVWVALSACGPDGTAPALEVVPRRVEDILPVDGVLATISIASDVIDELGTPTVIPDVAPGDAIMFDERFVHRTRLFEGMTEPRYAIECWFFASSHTSEDYTSLLV